MIHAVGAARRAAREEAPVKKCKTCPWRREGLEHCVLPRCML
nr:MAG TPA: Transcription factor/nuclear export subunit protein 2 [Caudoviricetes sp.]